MSHFEKDIALKEVLNDKGLTCPILQKEIVKSAFVRAIITIVFKEVGRGGVLALAPELEAKFIRKMERMNEVTPIPIMGIIAKSKMVISDVINQGRSGGNFKPVEFVKDLDLDLNDLSIYREYVSAVESDLGDYDEY